MLYRSTRGNPTGVDFTSALLAGLAPDGGLYVPEKHPPLPPGWDGWSYEEAVAGSLRLFGAREVDSLVREAASAFEHPDVAPIVEVGNRLVMELFHGPTLSFKDHALQVVTRLLDREVGSGLILAATSGDTGSAAIRACAGRGHLRVIVLFPDGMVSEFQRRQMTTVTAENVKAVAVKGTFDDCQALVKRAMSERPDLLAVNSINWARIAAQAGYFIRAGVLVAEPFDIVVPTGNFGNVYSAWTAKQMGVPIETITIANNANHLLADMVAGIESDPAGVIPTSAPAMDIQVPSNLERFDGDLPTEFSAGWSTDDEIAATISDVFTTHGYRMDPHTATAWRAGAATLGNRPQLVVATAHPAKFSRDVSIPERMAGILGLPERLTLIDADYSALDRIIR